MKRKYGNKKIIAYGKTFDSQKEFDFYNKLVLRKKAKDIKDFKCQVKYKFDINKKWMFTYNADFVIYHNDGKEEVIDVKAFDKRTQKYLTTSTFNLKKKIIEEHYGIKITLI